MGRLIDTRRGALRALLAVLAPMALLFLACLPLAIHHKRMEYLVARELERSGLPLFDQAVVTTLIHELSDFDPAAVGKEGGRGLLLLDEETARRHGLQIDGEPSPGTRPFYRRLLSPGAASAAVAHDERIDPRRQLEAGIAAYREPSRFDARLGAFARLVRGKSQIGFLHRVLADPEVEAFLAVGEARSPEELFDRLASSIQTAPATTQDRKASRRLASQLHIFRLHTQLFSRMLPRMRSRSGPTVVEYVNSIKDVLQWLLGFPKWVLHLLLGGGLFLVALATLVLARLPPRRAARLSALSIFFLAVGVEVLDALDAAISGKTPTTSGSLEDILVTCLLPVAALVFDRVGSLPHREPETEERRHSGDGMATP